MLIIPQGCPFFSSPPSCIFRSLPRKKIEIVGTAFFFFNESMVSHSTDIQLYTDSARVRRFWGLLPRSMVRVHMAIATFRLIRNPFILRFVHYPIIYPILIAASLWGKERKSTSPAFQPGSSSAVQPGSSSAVQFGIPVGLKYDIPAGHSSQGQGQLPLKHLLSSLLGLRILTTILLYSIYNLELQNIFVFENFSFSVNFLPVRRDSSPLYFWMAIINVKINKK